MMTGGAPMTSETLDHDVGKLRVPRLYLVISWSETGWFSAENTHSDKRLHNGKSPLSKVNQLSTAMGINNYFGFTHSGLVSIVMTQFTYGNQICQQIQ